MKYSKIPFILFAVSLPILWAGSQGRAVLRSITIHDNFETGDLGNWQFPFSEDWKILGSPSERYLHMLRNREPGVPRRPLQFALIKGAAVGSFDFQTRVRREGKSMIVVFNYVDTLHFYYTHLSADRGEAQPVHNGIFIVNGAPRVRIAGTSAEPALPDQAWHHVRVVRDAHTGEIAVFMDHAPKPLFSITDTTFTCGQIGIGSFDETGDFAEVNLTSTDAGCQPGSVIRPAAVKQ
jgi:hypothetical protein